MLEKEIENNILCFLEEIGIWARKINSVGVFDPKRQTFRRSNSRFNQRGMPDIIGHLNGRFLGIEVKTQYGKLNENQKEVIRKLQEDPDPDKRPIVFVARSVTQAFETLKPYISDWRKFDSIAAKWSKIEALYPNKDQ